MAAPASVLPHSAEGYEGLNDAYIAGEAPAESRMTSMDQLKILASHCRGLVSVDTFVNAVIRNFENSTGLSDTKAMDSLFDAEFAKQLKESVEKVRGQLFAEIKKRREEEIKRVTSGDKEG